MRKILIDLEAINITTRVIPVIKAMQAHGGFQPVVFSTLRATGSHQGTVQAFIKLLRENDLRVLTPESMGMRKLEARLDKLLESYRQAFMHAIGNSPQAQAISYRGVPMMKYAANMILQDNLGKARFMKMFESVISTVAPDLVLTGYDFGGLRRYFIMTANDLGIPTMALQYGAWRYLRSQRVADYFCVWGQKIYDMHRAEGYDESRLFITGAPHLDHCFRPDFSREKILGSVGLDPAKRTLVFGVAAHQVRDELDAVCRLLAGKDDLQLMVKLHPECGQDIYRTYQAIVERHRVPHAFLQFENMSPVDLLRASDILVSTYSNLVAEGLALGLDLVLICSHTPHESDENSTIQHIHNNADEYCRVAWTVDELSEQTARAIANPGELVHSPRSDYHREQLYHKVDGKASLRTVEVIESVLSPAQAKAAS